MNDSLILRIPSSSEVRIPVTRLGIGPAFLSSGPQPAAYSFIRGAQLSVDEQHYKLMCLLEVHPEMSQRNIAVELGISLGKVNYCLQALISKGWIKVGNFKNSRNKAAYMYLLTPRGFEQKADLTVRYLQIKVREYEALRVEIEQMRREARKSSASSAEGIATGSSEMALLRGSTKRRTGY